MLHRFKMLMNQQDGSPGGGAPAGAPNTPAPIQAQGTPAAPAGLDVQQIVAAVRDGIFADLRRAGVFPKAGKQSSDPPETPAPIQTQAAPAAGLTQQDVDKAMSRMRAFERSTAKAGLTDAQVGRMEKALKADNPDDVAAWSQSYLEEMGLVKSTTPNATNTPGQAQPAQRSGPPVSDGGAPGRDPGLPTEGQVWKMTTAERDALIREKGYAGAARELRNRLRQDLKGVRMLLPRPGG